MMIATKIIAAVVAFVAFVVLFAMADHGRNWSALTEEPMNSLQTARFSRAITDSLRQQVAANHVLSGQVSWSGGLSA